MKKNNPESISLPCLKGAMGDWYYYTTLLPFKEVATRVSLPREIREYDFDKSKLNQLLQRDLDPKRTNAIASYLKRQKQRFFNSLILGIFGGTPSWQGIDISDNETYATLGETDIEYLERSFGILTLNGSESIFAIDGQHRAFGIRKAYEENKNLGNEEIAAIFVAHKNTEDGIIRTRRLFSTLNRYAVPVNKAEIIQLSEDNNCAILTRELIEKYDNFEERIQIYKTNVIRPENTDAFSNIIALYDIVIILLTDKRVAGQKVSGKDYKKYTKTRADQKTLKKDYQYLTRIFNEAINSIPSLSNFFEKGYVDRKKTSTSLLFRPIGQYILFNVLAVAKEHKKKQQALNYFSKDDFNLKNKIWYRIFWDQETETLDTNKAKQRYATLLILDHLGIKVRRTKKDKEIFENYDINPNEI